MAAHVLHSTSPLPPDETISAPPSPSPRRSLRPLPVTPSQPQEIPVNLSPVEEHHQRKPAMEKRPSIRSEAIELHDRTPSQRSIEKRPASLSVYSPPTGTDSSSPRLPVQSYAPGSDASDTSRSMHDEPFDPSLYRDASYLMRHASGTSYNPLMTAEHVEYSPELPYHRAGPSTSHDPGYYDYPPEKVMVTLTADMVPPDSPVPGEMKRSTGVALSRDRVEAISEMDNAYFSSFHMKVCLIAGVGFFVDAYDIFSINVASTMLAYVYTTQNCIQFPKAQNAAIKAAAPVGNFIGQLLFGWLADRIGRKRMYGMELIIIIIGAFGQALASNNSYGTINIVGALVVWRFIMGLGIGGDYPLSAIISSEFAATHIRGRMMTAVFANQGWGQLVASVVGCLTLLGFKHGVSPNVGPVDTEVLKHIDQSWRILVGLGCIPAAIGLYSRLTIPETPRFTMDIERNVKQAVDDIDMFLKTGRYKFDPDSIVVRVIAPRASPRDFRQYFSQWDNLKILVGCAYSWFAIDVTFYGVGLNTDKFFNAIGFAPISEGPSGCPNPHLSPPAHIFQDATAVFDYFINLCTANMLLSAAGLIPGYWMTFLLIDKIGRRPIQLLGFTMLTILFLIMGFVFRPLVGESPQLAPSLFQLSGGAKGFIALFCIASFFQNFGPNTTTFVIPGEMFPTRYRSTCHGISAASGKIGAIISQFVLTMIDRPDNILKVYAPFAFTGILSTLLLFETKSTTLEENTNEDQVDFIKGPVRPDLPPEFLR